MPSDACVSQRAAHGNLQLVQGFEPDILFRNSRRPEKWFEVVYCTPDGISATFMRAILRPRNIPFCDRLVLYYNNFIPGLFLLITVITFFQPPLSGTHVYSPYYFVYFGYIYVTLYDTHHLRCVLAVCQPQLSTQAKTAIPAASGTVL
jgi:hypothetical protein